MPNFYSIYHSSINITPSCLGGHISISCCRSLSQSFGGHFLWIRQGRKPQNCRWNFDAIYHSSRDVNISGFGGQYDHKISPVSKKWHVFDVMPNNFQCTDWRPDCWILYPLHIQEKLRKGSAQCWTEIFYWLKNWAGAFLPPNVIRGLTSLWIRWMYFILLATNMS